MSEFNELLESIKQHVFDSARQNWLFGAGISCEANIPLMRPLTILVKSRVEAEEGEKCNEIVLALTEELPVDAHIEHYLSHLVDLIAISERSRNESANLGDATFEKSELVDCYQVLVKLVGEIVRFGYQDDQFGTIDNSLIDISFHLKFVNSIRAKKVNLERRATSNFFTTNYDTLLEDALAVYKINVIDGFSGGSMGFWNPDQEFSRAVDRVHHCNLYKLHGSVDWYNDPSHGLLRVRYGSKYMGDTSEIMIYPQASKYVETQKDPFASLFSNFKSALASADQNVLIVCGYSFGDEHINGLVEEALLNPANKTTLVAFAKENPNGDTVINPTLDRFLSNESIADRIFVAGELGIYNASVSVNRLSDEDQYDWWKFSGLTQFIEHGDI